MLSQVSVQLRARDPAAVSALGVARTRLGLADQITDLARLVYFEISIPAADREAAEHSLRRLLDATTVLCNPNKETARVALEPETLTVPGVALLVWDRESPRRRDLEAQIARALPDLGAVTVWRAVLWLPRLAGDAARQREILGRIALGVDGDAGLLVNPHADAHGIVEAIIPQAFLPRLSPEPR
jgi:phosphoribosylformylglycinamidine (FGAM) synthase PurS component